jgi:hypothetical protein
VFPIRVAAAQVRIVLLDEVGHRLALYGSRCRHARTGNVDAEPLDLASNIRSLDLHARSDGALLE